VSDTSKSNEKNSGKNPRVGRLFDFIKKFNSLSKNNDTDEYFEELEQVIFLLTTKFTFYTT